MRLRFLIFALGLLASDVSVAQSDMPAADSSSLDFKQWGLLAIQDGGRRKPIDTFARETLIKTTGRSSYTDKSGKKWQANDFILSMLLDTHDWKSEPMILVSLGQLIEKLGLDTTQRRFSFTQLTSLPELNVLATEAHALRKAEKPLDRVQSEVMSVSERLALVRARDGRKRISPRAGAGESDGCLARPAGLRPLLWRVPIRLHRKRSCRHSRPRMRKATDSSSVARRINCAMDCAG